MDAYSILYNCQHIININRQNNLEIGYIDCIIKVYFGRMPYFGPLTKLCGSLVGFRILKNPYLDYEE